MSRVRLAVFVIIQGVLGGCSGFGEALNTRVCWSGNLPAQCDRAFVEFTCPQSILVKSKIVKLHIADIRTRVTKGTPSPQVGELFSQYCPPHCIPIYVQGESPFETLHADVNGIIQRSGYTLALEENPNNFLLEFDLVLVDVRTDEPGWMTMKVTTRAQVAFKATKFFSDGDPQLLGIYEGKDEIAHAYAALGDYQNVLNGAYCRALRGFAKAVEEGLLEGARP